MSVNLGHPDNIEAATLCRCQRIAALWVNQLINKVTTRQKIKTALLALPSDDQAIVKEWLNTYYNRLKAAPKPKPKTKARRVVPDWVRR